MGNVLKTNYREPTGRDWAAFWGLTFDCWVTGRMKTFNLLPEEPPNIKQESRTPGSSWDTDTFIRLTPLTPFIAL